MALDASITDTVTGMKTQIASANAAVKTALTDHAGDPEALLQAAKVEKVAQNSLAAKASGRRGRRYGGLTKFIRSRQRDHKRLGTGGDPALLWVK